MSSNTELQPENIQNQDDWAKLAACRNYSRDDYYPFFPRVGETGDQKDFRILKAKRICEVCVVRVPCLEEAIRKHEYGIWGGTTEEERRYIRLDRRKAIRM